MKVPAWRGWRNTRLKCLCGGYWFPHRKGGGACDHSPRASYYLALRSGAMLSEAMATLSADQLERMFPLPAQSKGMTHGVGLSDQEDAGT